MRRDNAHPSRTLLAVVLLMCSGGLACGEDVLVGRWLLRSNVGDAGPGGDAGADAGGNPQALNAQRAREHARHLESDKNDPHDSDRPSDKSH
ncbi:MAG TPA: hypothetical protein VNN80_06315 [Polyangiaceae bacterium]|nr:hypothetical protein [Polyangiaceae bacterium]